MADREWDEGTAAWERLARRRRADALDALSDIGRLRRLLDRVELDAVRDARADRRLTPPSPRQGRGLAAMKGRPGQEAVPAERRAVPGPG